MSLLRAALILVLAGSAASALADEITCESHQDRPEPCGTVQPGSIVRLVRQVSRTPCIEGRNWGTGPDNDSLWVSGGCRAVFDVQPPDAGAAPQYGGNDAGAADRSPEWQRGFDDGRRGTFDRHADSHDYRIGYRAGSDARRDDAGRGDRNDEARSNDSGDDRYATRDDRDSDQPAKAQDRSDHYTEDERQDGARSDDRRYAARADRKENARQACIDRAAAGQSFGADQVDASEARWIGQGLFSVDLDTPTGTIKCTVDRDGNVKSLDER